MAYTKGFDSAAFMAYMENSYIGISGSDGRYARELIENIIEYAHKHEHISLDQFAYFVSDMLPEVEFSEIAAFCEDEILTSYGIDRKNEFWKN